MKKTMQLKKWQALKKTMQLKKWQALINKRRQRHKYSQSNSVCSSEKDESVKEINQPIEMFKEEEMKVMKTNNPKDIRRKSCTNDIFGGIHPFE